MKFLVFNIVVLLSLGYLVTGQKNQSVGNWLDALPEKILNSYETKDLTNFLPEKEVEFARTPAKNASEAESLVSKNVESKGSSQGRISAEKLEFQSWSNRTHLSVGDAIIPMSYRWGFDSPSNCFIKSIVKIES